MTGIQTILACSWNKNIVSKWRRQIRTLRLFLNYRILALLCENTQIFNVLGGTPRVYCFGKADILNLRKTLGRLHLRISCSLKIMK